MYKLCMRSKHCRRQKYFGEYIFEKQKGGRKSVCDITDDIMHSKECNTHPLYTQKKTDLVVEIRSEKGTKVNILVILCVSYVEYKATKG